MLSMLDCTPTQESSDCNILMATRCERHIQVLDQVRPVSLPLETVCAQVWQELQLCFL